ncbi:RsmB/NOP family class I SAM-dependent RNA methyltransferase [Croceicoccus ponticola]|uniref:RsmB/NOP family class I SAM-dependent RNA methyltransferase n=1 Tax=Croceicoccus ponticola TaxID=2217664 RepID=A0A437H1F0_9SPHN|nr:RsmB/NOP family class I SAM-dependent RNA methyltransferase [Croceicoccus ponticola]RVQ69461.1 RsmB/NOP family class I SAM-dependent RNA methyltransferase [Croceicoccus ponticola]
MTPRARVQAAIEILDLVVQAARTGGASADRIVAEGLKARRYAGSKDRRAIREYIYAAIRACGPVPQSGRAAMLRLAQIDPDVAVLFDGGGYGPAPIAADESVAEGGIAPAWLERALADSGVAGDDALALLGRAPLDVRVNALNASRDTIELPETGEPLAATAGLRFAPGTPVERWDAFANGEIEVQDGGSQLACMALGAKPGETVIDLCAGAGGKTIALAAAMANEGTLIASDTNRDRLSRLAPRAERAGASIAQTVLLDPGRELAALDRWRGKADAVLVDAPCSGTGTWRRNPETRWRLSESDIAKFAAVQLRLLEIAGELVRPGGRIGYITCSLLDAEGAELVEKFLARNPRFFAEEVTLPAGVARGPGWRLSPTISGTDGFFIARLGTL